MLTNVSGLGGECRYWWDPHRSVGTELVKRKYAKKNYRSGVTGELEAVDIRGIEKTAQYMFPK